MKGKNLNTTWDELKQSLLLRFSSHESEKETRRFIQRRIQKYRESFNDYALEMESLNGRLTQPFPEAELLDIIRDNMNPTLQSVTLQANFTTIEDLRNTCQRYERLWNTSSWPARMPKEHQDRALPINSIIDRPKEDVLSPKLINLSESSNMQDTAKVTESEQIDAIESSNLICWNCKDIGHRYQDCSKNIVEIFCFGCGKAGVRKPNCIRCLKVSKTSSNYYPNAVRPGIPRSENIK